LALNTRVRALVGVPPDALIKTHAENLSSFVVDPYYSMYHNSHPTLTERLAAIDQIAVPKAKSAKAD
jgi:STE24 endopeptidase